MKCSRCESEIKVSESDSLLTFTNLIKSNTKTARLCERCSLNFLQWFASGNYIQKQINAEETKSKGISHEKHCRKILDDDEGMR